jgi:hypothetical protein
MSARYSGAVPAQWCDAQGSPLLLGCRVRQIGVDRQGGALPCWLHQHGRVVGWDTTWLYLCMDQHRTLVVLRPHLVRVLDPPRRSR